jgi:hypothetical protein
MSKINALVSRTKILLAPDSSRVVLRKFNPNPESRISSIIGRINALSEKEVTRNLKVIVSRFSKRHLQTEETLLRITNLSNPSLILITTFRLPVNF